MTIGWLIDGVIRFLFLGLSYSYSVEIILVTWRCLISFSVELFLVFLVTIFNQKAVSRNCKEGRENENMKSGLNQLAS